MMVTIGIFLLNIFENNFGNFPENLAGDRTFKKIPLLLYCVGRFFCILIFVRPSGVYYFFFIEFVFKTFYEKQRLE